MLAKVCDSALKKSSKGPIDDELDTRLSQLVRKLC